MKTINLILAFWTCIMFSPLFSQSYSLGDSLLLIAVDDSCDLSSNLNWDTEPNPENWTGVTWSNGNPRRVQRLLIAGRSLSGKMDLTGLTELNSLECSSNQLTALEVSTLTNLTSLSCYYNQIKVLDVPDLVNLTYFTCSGNQITELDVTNLVNLTYLGCSANQISVLDVSDLVNLTFLGCNFNQLATLDVSNLTGLTELYCQANDITVLDVSDLTDLTILYCYDNKLTSLTVTNLTSLAQLDCSLNNISELNVASLVNLTDLSCYTNQLTNLDVSNLTNLTKLLCSNNQLSLLNVASLTKLTELQCNNNQISILELQGLVHLMKLQCAGNQLRSFNLSSLSSLEELICENNMLPLSILAAGLFADTFTYTPQDTVFEKQTYNGNRTIDYSSEALIEGTATSFVFYKNGTQALTNTTGLFTTTGNGKYYCSMTNAKLPNLTITTSVITITGSTGLASFTQSDFVVYPNPVTTVCTFNYPVGRNIRIDIYSNSGILLRTHQDRDRDGQTRIGFECYGSGVYLYRITGSEISYFGEIIKCL